MASSSNRGDCFKTFLAERKAEYRSKFPFLTESQVVAKLKRLWKNQQARDSRATAVKSHAADTKSECCNNKSGGDDGDKCTRDGDSVGQSVLMSSSNGLPGETLRRKVKPPSLSRSLTRFAASAHSVTTLSPHHPPSPTNKENTNLPTNSSPATNSNSDSNLNSPSPLQATGGATFSFSSSCPALDCYAFTEDEQQIKSSCYSEGGGSSSFTLGLVKHKHQRLTQPISLSTNAESDQNITELKSSKGSSSYGSKLKVATQLPNDSASLHTSNKLKSKQANKKPSGAAHWGMRKTRSSARNAVPAATNYYQATTTTMNSGSTTSGVGVISAASAGCVDIREEQHSLSTQAIYSGDNMKGVSVPLSDHRAFGDSDPSLDREMASNRRSCTGDHEQQQEQRQALQPAAGAIVDVDLDDECCTMLCYSVYNESQIMGLALRSSDQTQGNVESDGPLPGLSEHSHGHNINTAINTESSDADLALSGISSALGNPKTDSKPTQTSDSASGSCPLQSREPVTCVHNLHESAEVVSLGDDARGDLEGTGSIVGGRKQQGRGRGRRRGRKRGREQGKKNDSNESWIRTNSQPQTCDPVGDLLEFSQTEQISSSLPEGTAAQEEPGSDMIWEESSLPNMVVSKESVPEGSEKESSLRRPGLGTRASFRGRGRRGVHGGGRGQRGRGTMETGTIHRRVVTRSRTAALLKCKMEEAEGREKMDFSSEPEIANLPSSLSPPPPAKKQKQRPKHGELPSASRESKEECSGDNGVTIMDVSASSPANIVCSANDGVALSDTVAANSVCSKPRDSSAASALFSTDSVNLDSGSKHTPSLTVRPSCEESVLFETPSLQCHATASIHCTTTTAAEAGYTGVVSSSGKPCKSSSPSPPFAQCSSSTTTTATTSCPQAQQPSMQLTPIQVDPLCDMFLPLTPERKKNDIYKGIGSFYSEVPAERRTVLPAPAGSEDKGYCLFADDADIFL